MSKAPAIHHASQSGQGTAANSSRHIAVAMSSCTHFCPFSRDHR